MCHLTREFKCVTSREGSNVSPHARVQMCHFTREFKYVTSREGSNVSPHARFQMCHLTREFKCVTSREGSNCRCFIVDTSGYLVFHDDFIRKKDENVEYMHITEKVRQLFQLVSVSVTIFLLNDEDKIMYNYRNNSHFPYKINTTKSY